MVPWLEVPFAHFYGFLFGTLSTFVSRIAFRSVWKLRDSLRFGIVLGGFAFVLSWAMAKTGYSVYWGGVFWWLAFQNVLAIMFAASFVEEKGQLGGLDALKIIGAAFVVSTLVGGLLVNIVDGGGYYSEEDPCESGQIRC